MHAPFFCPAGTNGLFLPPPFGIYNAPGRKKSLLAIGDGEEIYFLSYQEVKRMELEEEEED